MSLHQGSSARSDGHGPDGEAVTPFGNYLLLHAFARGGMGEVYLARVAAGTDERYCVLKKLRPDLTRDSEYVRRFIDEARVVVQLHHPNICHVFDVGRVSNEYYLAMEYVSGLDTRTLHDRARSREEPVPVAVALHIVAEVLDALDYAHQRTHPVTGEPLHLIHRDVSPQNVMVSYGGDVKLIDFGLASSRLKVEKTQPNVVMGKMAYMAPEQARGEGIDATVDLFAAAVLAYELCTGERFYEGMAAQEIWAVAGRGDFKPRRWAALDGELTRILARALHPTVKKRYATGHEFRDALRHYLARRHPASGPEALRAYLADAFASEKERELEALRGYGAIEHRSFQDALESSRSLSVSLAHSDLLDRILAGARHGDLAGLGVAPEGEQTRLSGMGATNSDIPTDLGGPRAFEAEPDTEADERTAVVARSPRSWSGTAAASPTRVGEHTEVVLRASGSQSLSRSGLARARPGSSFWPGLLIGAFVVGAAGVFLFPERLPRGSPFATAAASAAAEAGRAPGEPGAAVEGGAPPGRAGAASEALATSAEASEEPPALDAPAAAAPSRARAPVGADDASVEEPRAPRGRARKAPRRGRRGASTDSGAIPPDVAPKGVAAPPAAPGVATAAPPPPAALEATPAPRAEKSSPPAWAALSREERLGLLRSCDHPCREQVTAEYVTLKVKERTAPPARRKAAQDAFDALWMGCYKRCR